MKFGVISDIHLGEIKFRKVINGQNAWSSLAEDAFRQGINELLERQVEAIVIPGDLFDTPNPDIHSILTAKDVLESIKVPILLLGGNHEWSQRQSVSNIHPFNLLNLQYKVYNEAKGIELNGVKFMMLPYKALTPEGYTAAANSNYDILVAHGILDSEDDAYKIPQRIANKYKLLILGHVHTNSLVGGRTLKVLTPGSVMPANTFQGVPSVWTCDTSTWDIEKIELKTPTMHENFVESGKINEFLKKIQENPYCYDLYSIHYAGSVKDVDPIEYKRGYEHCLSIRLLTNEGINTKKSNYSKTDDFWEFVRKNHSEWFDEFKEILK